MDYGFRYGFLGKTNIRTNVCLHIEYDSSQYYGYIYNSLGSADPDQTNDGQIFYSFIWDNQGSFIAQFGASGDEQVDFITSLFVYSSIFKKGRELLWNETLRQYEFTDIDLAETLISEFNSGNVDMCLFIGIEDGLIIDYSYNTILTGTKT